MVVAFMWISLSITAACWLYSWRVFAKLRGVPKNLKAPVNGPKISIVIPARNEESNLAVLLPTLTSQTYPAHEIIVVDDDSDDKTAHVAEENGARVIKNKPLPEDWFGKQWACYNGAGEAGGDWILFLDADTSLDSSALEKFAALSEKPESVHSVCPFHEIEKPYEEFSSFFNAIMILGSNAFTSEGDRASETGLFGQALFVRKSDYDAIDGHASVKRDLPENFVMARHFAKIGLTCRCYLGRGIASMRMYPTNLKDLIAGWGKGFVSGAGETPKSALIGISIWLSGLIMSTVSLTFLALAPPAVIWTIAVLYVLFVIQCLFVFRKIGTFSIWNAVFFPVALIFYQWLFFRSIAKAKSGAKIAWKGRDVS